MPMDPMDVMWMSKAPTVSDVVVGSPVTFKSVCGSPPNSPSAADGGIRPDFDTDVLWKPNRMSHRDRTTSSESTDSELGRKISDVPLAAGVAGSLVDVQQPRTRRLSFTEMIFGSPTGGFSWGQASTQATAVPDGHGGRKASITEDARFKELMKHQNKVLGDG